MRIRDIVQRERGRSRIKVQFNVSVRQELIYDLVHSWGHDKDYCKGMVRVRFRMSFIKAMITTYKRKSLFSLMIQEE